VADGRTERRLAAIMAADVVGYSRMMALDEAMTLRLFKAAVAEALEPLTREHGGRIVKTMGDGVLAEFASAVEALACAAAFQRAMAERNAPLPSPQRLDFRIGIHDGDVVVENGDVFGDVVVLAARLQSMAPPGGLCVSARVREDVAGRVELVFDDAGEQRLKNIDRPVRVFRVHFDGATAARPMLDLPDKPSIAVLPFDNMSGDPGQVYFADGVTEDIITALSHWRWFFVIARNSSFIYKGRSVDVKQVGRELGVRYVLEGSVRRLGSRARITCQLIDAASAAHVWAETYDRDIADIFALQDEITQSVVAAVEPAMMRSESQRMSRKAIRDLTAFECAQRGVWHINQGQDGDYDAAVGCFNECIARDPEMALGHVGLARALYGKVVYGFTEDAEADLKLGYETAKRGVALDPQDAYAYLALSGCLLYLGRHTEALDAAEHAIALNPNFAIGHFRLGQVLAYSGRPAEAIAPIKRSMRHNPYDPRFGALLFMLAIAEHHAGDFEAAVEHAHEAVRRGEARATTVLGSSLARLGRFEEARAAFPPAAFEQLSGNMRLLSYAKASDLAYAIEGLRLAAYGPQN
jgi:adenylate cyclase